MASITGEQHLLFATTEDAAWEGRGVHSLGETLRQLCGPTKDKLYLDLHHLPYEFLPAGMEEQGKRGRRTPGSPLLSWCHFQVVSYLF